MKSPTLLLLFLLSLIYTQPAFAFRCKGKIINVQSFSIDIQQQCGVPMSLNQYIDYKIIALQDSAGHDHYRHIEFITVPVQVEEWIYNLGPNDLMRQLRFENGRLIEIMTLGYGY